MISLITILLATTLTTRLLAHNPRILDRKAESPILPRADDMEVELMESGYARSHEHVPAPPRADSMDSIHFSDDDTDYLAVPVPQALNTGLNQQQHHLRHAQPPFPAIDHPPPQAMNSEIEMVSLGHSPLLGPHHVNSSGGDPILPPAAMTTGSPSPARCMQCVQSCVEGASSVMEAVGEYCTSPSRHRCTVDPEAAVDCTILGLICCATLATILGMTARSS